jgi:TonB family protein
MVLVAGLGVGTTPTETRAHETPRLVFLATPGPGGGGGGGGLRSPLPPPKARVRGASTLRSPVTVARKVESPEPARRVETPPPPVPEPQPAPPPPPARTEPTPPVSAPVATAPADDTDQAGVIGETPETTSSMHGPGEGGGTGSGRGTGSGEGHGAGIGPGSTAGIGGGPYRPGSGITPPTLQHEVKPDYTEEGRRRSVEGDVVLEVVVRADGTVGTVRILQGLGSGLNERAVEAVRRWRFAPARRFGTPVDVLVEVAVEFRLR